MIRVNEQTVLAMIHTLFVREHNRIASELGKINPQWNDETLFQVCSLSFSYSFLLGFWGRVEMDLRGFQWFPNRPLDPTGGPNLGPARTVDTLYVRTWFHVKKKRK